MRARLLAAMILLTAGLAGCVAGTDAVEPPEQGPFVTVWWTCGFVLQGTFCTHWQLDADGTLVGVRGIQEPGNGTIHADPDALYNVTTDDVRSILQTFDLYNATSNYTIELAYRGHATDDEVSSLLVPAAGFYDTQRRYDDPTVADAGTLNIEVHSQRGTHISSAYTGDGDDSFNAMRDAFFEVEQDVTARLGVPSDA